MIFRTGDKVRFLNEKGEGIIRGFRGKKTALVEIEDGFEIPFPLDQLVRIHQDTVIPESDVKEIHPDAIKGVKKIILEKESAIRSGPRTSKKHRSNSPVTEEVDLHIENLLDNFRGMTNTEIINIQINRCISKLESAIRRKVNRIVFIHGVGEGVLKSEIRKVLSTYSNIEFYDASYSKYGFGATEVLIK
jgi:hypothetical protein